MNVLLLPLIIMVEIIVGALVVFSVAFPFIMGYRYTEMYEKHKVAIFITWPVLVYGSLLLFSTIITTQV